MINYMRIKRILLKEFRNKQIYIEIVGYINTKFYINNSRLLINKHKIIISNEEADCIILLDYIEKIKIKSIFHIEFFTENEKYILEV